MFSCKVYHCRKRVKGVGVAMSHYQVHADEKFEFRCPKCLSVIKRRASLRQHLRVNHGQAFTEAEMEKFKKKRPHMPKTKMTKPDFQSNHSVAQSNKTNNKGERIQPANHLPLRSIGSLSLPTTQPIKEEEVPQQTAKKMVAEDDEMVTVML